MKSGFDVMTTGTWIESLAVPCCCRASHSPHLCIKVSVLLEIRHVLKFNES